jgi:hypothetical protein
MLCYAVSGYYPEPQDHNYHPVPHVDEPYARANTPDTQYGPTHQEYNRIERDYVEEHPEYQFSPKHHQCKQHKPIVCKPGFGLDPARLASYLKGAYIVPTCEKCKAGTTSPGERLATPQSVLASASALKVEYLGKKQTQCTRGALGKAFQGTCFRFIMVHWAEGHSV